MAAIVPAATAHAMPGDLTAVGLDNTGTFASAETFAGVPSATGRYVAFLSTANLTGVPTGGKTQVFVRDRQRGTTVLASSSPTGDVGNDAAAAGYLFTSAIDISSDGRYVVFASRATNLVPNDTNGSQDVFRKDLTTGAVRLISSADAPNNPEPVRLHQGNGDSSDPSISADGSRVTFVTRATNLGIDRTDPSPMVVLRDRNDSLKVVSTNAAGTPANGPTGSPAISADGNWVAFEAQPTATNLYDGDTNGATDVIVKSLTAPGTTTVAGAGTEPDISGDGRYVTFQTKAAIDPANDTNGELDVYRRDITAKVTTLVSARNGLSRSGTGRSFGSSISADGTRVAFASAADDLDAGDSNGLVDEFTRTIATGATARASQTSIGTDPKFSSLQGSLSGNGGVVTFSAGGAFTASDTNVAYDVYAKDLDPTDTTGPDVSVVSFVRGDGKYGGNSVTVKATDPSGIVLVNDAPAADQSNGVIELSAPWSGSFTVTVTDGAGNASTINVPIPFAGQTAKTVKPKITALTKKNGLIRASYRTSTGGGASIWVERLTVTKRGRPNFVRVTLRRQFIAHPTDNGFASVPLPKRHGLYRVVMVSPSGRDHTLVVSTRQFRN